MKCRLVQESWVPHEDAVYDRVGNILLSRIMGAEVELVDEGFDIGIRESWEDGDRGREGQGRQALCHPGRRLGAQVRRARLCRLRRGGARAGDASSASGSTTSSSARSPARPMPAWWSASPPTAARATSSASTPRSRPAQTKAQVLDIAQNTADAGRARPGHHRRRRRAARGLRLSGLRRALEGDHARRSACARGWKA